MLISFRYSLLIALCLACRVYARDDFSDSWTSCSMVQSIDEKYTTGIDNTFYTSYAMNSFAYLKQNYTAECMLMPVPYAYDIVRKKLPTRIVTAGMNVFIKHIKHKQNPPSDRILIIYNDLLYPNAYYVDRVADVLLLTAKDIEAFLDIYIIDPRGIGRSTTLDCPLTGIYDTGSIAGCLVAEEEIQRCIQEMNSVYGSRDMSGHLLNTTQSSKTDIYKNGTMIFSTVQSAFDFYYIANHLFEGKKISIYANQYEFLFAVDDSTSGSSLILTHILQLEQLLRKRNKIDAVIYDNALDIQLNYKENYIDLMTIAINATGTTYLKRCVQFSDSIKLYLNHQSIRDALLDSNEQKKCASIFEPPLTGMGLDSDSLSTFLASLLINPSVRNSLAYVIPYILKCKPEDRDTLKKIIEDNKYVFRGTPGITCDNQLLSRLNILFSELFAVPPDKSLIIYIYELIDKENDQLFSFKLSRWLQYYSYFPHYSLPEEYLTYPQTNARLLMLTNSGPLNVTTQSLTVYHHIRSPSKHLVALPTSYSFSSLLESAYQTPTNKRDCGIDILYSFLYDVDQQRDLNTSCLSRLSDVYCFPDRNSTSSSTFISSLKANLFTNDIQQLYINAFISVVSTSILCSVIFFVPLSFLYLVYSLVLSFIL